MYFAASAAIASFKNALTINPNTIPSHGGRWNKLFASEFTRWWRSHTAPPSASQKMREWKSTNSRTGKQPYRAKLMNRFMGNAFNRNNNSYQCGECVRWPAKYKHTEMGKQAGKKSDVFPFCLESERIARNAFDFVRMNKIYSKSLIRGLFLLLCSPFQTCNAFWSSS